MIVDPSALTPVLRDEPDAEAFARALATADALAMSAGRRRGWTSGTASPTRWPSQDEPLLLKGDDLTHTDVRVAAVERRGA